MKGAELPIQLDLLDLSNLSHWTFSPEDGNGNNYQDVSSVCNDSDKYMCPVTV